MKRTNVVALSVGLIVVVAGIITLRILRTDGGPSDVIRIGFNTWVGYGPLYIARDKGFFAKHGVEVSLLRMEGTGERRSAMMAKRLEAVGSTIDDLVVGAAQGVPGKMVLAVDPRFDLFTELLTASPVHPAAAERERAAELKQVVFEGLLKAIENGVPKSQAAVWTDSDLGESILLRGRGMNLSTAASASCQSSHASGCSNTLIARFRTLEAKA